MLLTVVSLCCDPDDWQCGPSSPEMLQSPGSTEQLNLIPRVFLIVSIIKFTNSLVCMNMSWSQNAMMNVTKNK